MGTGGVGEGERGGWGSRRRAKATGKQQAQERKRERGQGGPKARPPGQKGRTGPCKHAAQAAKRRQTGEGAKRQTKATSHDNSTAGARAPGGGRAEQWAKEAEAPLHIGHEASRRSRGGTKPHKANQEERGATGQQRRRNAAEDASQRSQRTTQQQGNGTKTSRARTLADERITNAAQRAGTSPEPKGDRKQQGPGRHKVEVRRRREPSSCKHFQPQGPEPATRTPTKKDRIP